MLLPGMDRPAPGAFKLRVPCSQCGGGTGEIRPRGDHDCVYCDCGVYQYNAPRIETGRRERTSAAVHAALGGNRRVRILFRANAKCELCGASGELHVGHLLSVKEGLARGMTEVDLNADENLCAMCKRCNASIGDRTVTLRFALMLELRRAARRGTP